jgi:hypothetical protein
LEALSHELLCIKIREPSVLVGVNRANVKDHSAYCSKVMKSVGEAAIDPLSSFHYSGHAIRPRRKRSSPSFPWPLFLDHGDIALCIACTERVSRATSQGCGMAQFAHEPASWPCLCSISFHQSSESEKTLPHSQHQSRVSSRDRVHCSSLGLQFKQIIHRSIPFQASSLDGITLDSAAERTSVAGLLH